MNYFDQIKYVIAERKRQNAIRKQQRSCIHVWKTIGYIYAVDKNGILVDAHIGMIAACEHCGKQKRVMVGKNYRKAIGQEIGKTIVTRLYNSEANK